MTHDPMCPFAPWPDERCYQPDAGVSICSIIAKVREDERDKDLDYRYIAAQAEAQGQRDALAAERERIWSAVVAMRAENPVRGTVVRRDVLNIIDNIRQAAVIAAIKGEDA